MAGVFVGWELWQQLTFVLACGLVVAILLGLLKLAHSSRKIRKSAALEKIVRKTSILREKSIIRSLSKKVKGAPRRQRTAPKSRAPGQRRQHVYFGIKALEKGVLAEGVWNSGKNTSPAAMIRPKVSHVTQYEILPDLEAQGPAIVSHPAARHRRIAPSAPLANVKPQLQTTPAGRLYPPHSFMRYADYEDYKPSNRRSGSRTRPPQDISANRVNDSPLSPRPSIEPHSPYSDDDKDKDDSVHSSSPDHLMSTAPFGRPLARDTSASSIQLINAHRASLGAETGQIQPRLRSTSISDVALVQSHVSADADHTLVDNQQPLHRASSLTRVPGGDESDVLRHVNTGFAILRPGTLGTPSPPAVADGTLDALDSQATLAAAASRRASNDTIRRGRASSRSFMRRGSRASSSESALDGSASQDRKLKKRRPSSSQKSIQRPST